MRLGFVLYLSAAALAADRQGLPARSQPGDYPFEAAAGAMKIGVEVLDREQVRNAFSTDLRPYIVVEVAVYPGAPVDLDVLDFALKPAGRPLVRPASAKSIAALNQKRARGRADDILLYPSVGVGIGNGGYGTSTGVGVGVGVGSGGGPPAPASTDRDREVMQLELEERALPEGRVHKPVAGYLYFPVGTSRRGAYELEYDGSAGKAATRIKVPDTK